MTLRSASIFLVALSSVFCVEMHAQTLNRESVSKLFVVGKGSRKIPDSIYLYKNLAEIELIEFRLARLPKKLLSQSQLKKVTLTRNSPRRKLRLQKNSSITALIIREDEKGKLPRSYKRFDNLEYLNLSRDKLEKIPNIKGCDRLKRLVLVRNSIKLDNRPRRLVTSLTNIDLTFNEVTVLPGWIGELTDLKVLNLANNKIEKVEPGLEKIKALTELSFYNNNLKEIPPMIYTMTSLKVIDLYYNHIPSVSGDIANLKDLEIIYLANNEIDAIPGEIGQLTKLKELYIHHNKLSSLPGTISDLKSLTTLRFNHNNIAEWPTAVGGLKLLSHLDFSSNKIKSIPVSDLDFPEMKLLQMGGNPWNVAAKAAIETWATKLRERNTIVRTDVTP